jgi:TonB-linked SusC/RagA family outer membrane protein
MIKKLTLLITFLLAICTFSYGQTHVIKGTVSDSKGLPVPGVTVKVKGTGNAVATDGKGSYSLTVADNAVLVFTSVGYGTQEHNVNSKTSINVTLLDDTKQLNDVVVIGYGSRRQKDVTGSISTIKAEQLENENPNSVTDLLKGNVAGINVNMSASAKGGASSDLLVRGKTTLSANTAPLIILDGVIYQGQLADINPNDIETIDVLKDASSLAVYGSKAATGVVAITTKKGNSVNGSPIITLNANVGVAQLEHNQKVYDPQGFLNWREDVQRANNTSLPAYQFTDPRQLPAGVTVAQWMALTGATGDPVDQWLQRLGLVANERTNYFAGKTEDWAKDVFRNGLRQDYTASLSGKKEDMSYYMSANYTDNQNIIAGAEYKNYRFRVNLDGQASKFLTFGVNAQFASRDESPIAADWTQIVNNSPYGDFYNADGSLRRIPTDDNGLNARNPFLATQYDERVAIQNTLFANLYAKAKLPFGIKYQFNFAPDIESYRNFYHNSSLNPNVTTPGGSATRSMENRYKYTIDNLLTWNKTFGIHSIDVTLLAEAEKYQTWYDTDGNQSFSPTDDLSYHNIGSGNLPTVSSDDRVYTASGLMARVNSSLLGRYLLTGSVRRDGYSAFGQNNPYANFPAGAFAWIFTDESFVKGSKALSWLNYGKLRISYGVNGNRDLQTDGTVDPTIALALLGSGKYPVISSGTATAGSAVYVNNLANAGLKWEQTASLNFGLDFAVLNNRLSGSIEAYHKKTTDLLVSRSIPQVMGYNQTTVISNLGQLDNNGIEVTLTSKNIRSTNFNWSTSATFALNRNSLKHLYGPTSTTDANGNTITTEANDPGNNWFIGKDVNVVWDYKVIGVWQTSEKTQAALYSAVPGDFKLEKLVNSGPNQYKYTDADKQFIGYTSPRYTWSLRNDFNFLKNFDFSFLLVSNMGQLNQFNQAKNNPGSVGNQRQTSYVYPYWTADNPINDYARLNSGSSGTSFNVYRSASFVRVNTISLAYNLPRNLVHSMHMQNLKVYANANNAYVYAPNWHYWDPQNTTSDGRPGPTPRIISFGVNATF